MFGLAAGGGCAASCRQPSKSAKRKLVGNTGRKAEDYERKYNPKEPINALAKTKGEKYMVYITK